MTQAELAEKIGVSSKTVSKRETAKGLPDMIAYRSKEAQASLFFAHGNKYDFIENSLAKCRHVVYNVVGG